ncbi:MAG TPA: response regulator [Candidatus Obscuribacterales bacterium]
MKKLLIVEPIPLLRQHCSRIVESVVRLEPKDVAYVNDCRAAVAIYSQTKVPLVITDTTIGDMSGIMLAKHIWSANEHAKILFWCSALRPGLMKDIEKVARRGSLFGFVSKAEGDKKLTYAVESIFLRDNPYFDPIYRECATFCDDLSQGEADALKDLLLGLTDKAIAARRGLTVRGVQSRFASLTNKLMKQEHVSLRQAFQMEIYNPRNRLMYRALQNHVIGWEEIVEYDRELERWLELKAAKGEKAWNARFSRPTQHAISFAPDGCAQEIVVLPSPQSIPHHQL